jgi:PAS domain S-box-containing protein
LVSGHVAGGGQAPAVVAEATQEERTRARLAAIVTSCPDPIIGETLDGIITDWNPAAERLYGYTAADAIGQPLAMLTPPERRDEVVELLDRVRRGSSVEAFETVRRARDGRLIEVSLTVFPICNDAGELIGASATTRDITERKRAERELSAARQRTRDILERIADGFLALDQAGTIVDANLAAERILQESRDHLIGTSLWNAFGLTADAPFTAAYHAAVSEGKSTSIEVFSPPREAWLEARIDPSPDGPAIFFRDVTATRQLTQDLRASEAKFRTLVEQLPCVVYLTAADEQETPLYFSPYLEVLVGVHPDDALQRDDGETWLDYVHPDDRERVAAVDRLVDAAGGEFRAEYRTRRADGSFIWVRNDCAPVFDEQGAIVAWQGVILDISDRIEAEEAQARLAAIVEGAEDAIISRTLDGAITSWNGGAERLYGMPAGEMIGQPIQQLLPEEDASIGLVPAEDLGEQPIRFESASRRADGTPIEVAISLSPIRDRNGRIVGVSSITRDVTERKLAEEALRVALAEAQAATQAKSRFLAILSHELRTPLQAVLGYADYLLNAPTSTLGGEDREDVGYIHNGAMRMVTLIEQMLDLSRMEAGQLNLKLTDVDLAEIVEQVRQDVAPQAEAKGIGLEISVPPALPLVRGDAHRLRQILLNLAGNAVKFTEQGTVRISAVPTASGGVDVAVSDTGIGIAPDAQDRIFEEFQQVDGAQTRRYGGAGLGLSIARGLAEQMNGTITVSSVPGDGATFTLRLGDG